MIVVLICSRTPVEGELRGAGFFRGDVECFSAHRVQEAQVMAVAAHPDLVLIDRDLPGAEDLIHVLREDPGTRRVPIAVMARGDFSVEDVALLSAGANAVLRFPPGPEWDTRLARLVNVAARADTHLAVDYALHLRGRISPAQGRALTMNLSASGMLIATSADTEAHVGDTLIFTLHPPGARPISGRARVQRQPAPHQLGVEFMGLEEDGSQRIRRIVAAARAA